MPPIMPEQQTATDQIQDAETPVRSGRRKFVAQAAAAPAILAVSGRSALATYNTCNAPTGLSLVAWMSAHPGGAGTCAAAASHTVRRGSLGLSPGYWKPNKEGQCFQGPWPDAVQPFATCWQKVDRDSYRKVTFGECGWRQYTNMQYNYPDNEDAGWNTGTKAAWLGDPAGRSISRILIDDNGSLNWHFCNAWLCALYAEQTNTEYPLTPTEVIDLHQTTKSLPDGGALTAEDIKAFLSQTWG